jgi:hypothetical protein
MTPVSISDNSDSTFRISWDEPADNGSPILAYQIKILSSVASTYFENTLECDGATLTNTYCDV